MEKLFIPARCLTFNGSATDAACLNALAGHLLAQPGIPVLFGDEAFIGYFLATCPQLRGRTEIVSWDSEGPEGAKGRSVFICATHIHKIIRYLTLAQKRFSEAKFINFYILEELAPQLIPERAFQPIIPSIYPIAIPEIRVEPGLDFLLLDLPASYSLLRVGFGYVDKILRALPIRHQTLDLNIITYHRFHMARLLDRPEQMGVGNYELPGEPWSPLEIDEWSKPELLSFFQNEIDETVEAIVGARPKIVGISIHLGNRLFARTVVRRIREKLPETVIIVGGFDCVHVEFGPRTFEDFDHMIIGEAETSLPLLVTKLLAGAPCRDLPGIVSKSDSPNRVWQAGPRPENLDEIGFPRYEWADLSLYRTHDWGMVGEIAANRGCKWSRCTFCCECFPWRTRSAKNIVDEIEWLAGRGFSFFNFSVSDAIGDWVTLAETAREITKRDLKVQINSQLRIDKRSDAAFFRTLYQAGFRHLAFGVDGWTDRILKLQNKGANMKLVEQNLQAAHEAGIMVSVNIVVGIPGEIDEDLEQSIGNIVRLKNYISSFNSIYPLILAPGSKYYSDPDSYDIKFRVSRDELIARYPHLIPPQLWYSESPYIDHLTRAARLKKICEALLANDIVIDAHVRYMVNKLYRQYIENATEEPHARLTNGGQETHTPIAENKGTITMDKTGKSKLLSILCQGRNDDYMGNFIWRLSTVLNKICANIACLGAEDEVEVLVCDWGSEKPLHTTLELSEQARCLTRFLIVPPDIAAIYHKDAGFSGVHAVNAAARRAAGRYLLFSDSDVYLPLETMAKVLKHVRKGYIHSYALTDSFFWASKYHIPNEFISQSPFIEDLEEHIRKNWHTYVHEPVNTENFMGSGVALLMSRDMWHESRGVDEKLIYMGWNDIDFTRRLMWKYRMDDLENHGMFFFHLEHYKDRFSQNWTQEHNRKLNPYVEPTQFAANPENWGLGDHQLQVMDGFGVQVGQDGYTSAYPYLRFDMTKRLSSVREILQTNPLYHHMTDRFAFMSHSWFTNDEALGILMEILKPHTICEIGSAMGASARFMASYVSVKSIVCVDHWDRRRVEKYQPGILPEAMVNNMYEHFLTNAVHAGIDDRIYPLRLSSREAAQYCQDHNRTFDLIYIDGDHTTIGARNDILMWCPLLAPGGILCGDDWSWQKEPDNVAGAVISVAKEKNWQVFYYGNFWLTLPGGFGVKELTGEVFTRIKPITASEPKSSELDQIIPPEISGDELYFLIEKLAREEQVTNVLEIGSSAGGGSTEAFVNGLRQNPGKPRLFCMEVSRPRFGELQKRYAGDSFVHPYNVSSVPPALFPAEREVELFYQHIPTVLNNYPLELVLGWRTQDMDYIRDAGVETDGIELIRRENGIDRFDMVLIDGSEFTGKAELDKVYGARIILLDDINGFKNYANYKRLKEDPNYQLIAENWQLRNGYAAFRRVEQQQDLPVHFLTIVLNGEPFIRHHIEAFKKLPFNWHWHIVEGVADLKRDTAWSLQFGGRITDELHAGGLSNDGTSAYLDQLAAAFPENITVYRKPAGVFWDGKVEMVNNPLPNIKENCLLWQLDSDELWTAEQLAAMRELFLMHPHKTAAYFHCHYFVGPGKYVSSLNTWATYPKDWIRVWRFAPGMSWAAHEPPVLVDGQGRNVAEIDPFSRDETMSRGITFQHFAYVTEEQVRFKEIYYGYTNAVAHWRELQKTTGPVNPARYLPWAKNDATVDDWPAAKGQLLAATFFAAPGQKDYFSMAVDGATLFEAKLRQLFQQIRPTTIIETGTYLGQGTSSIIWRALKDFAINADFTTIEVNPIHHVQAVNHFRQNGMQINAELGLTLPRNLLPNQEEIADKFIRNKEYDGIYYDHDEADRAQYYFAETNFDVPENLLYKTMERYRFQPAFVLLDSAGHLGFAEFQYFMTLIKGDCYLMLDDIYHCKHYKTLQVIKKDPRFQILVESGEKFGFCIARYTHVNSVLFVRPDSIGDNVLAAGMVHQLKRAYGNARITVVCRQHLAEIYEACPEVAEVIGFDRDRAYDNEDYRNLLLQRLQSVKADIALNTLYSRELIGELFTIGSGARITVAFDGNLCNMTVEQRQTCDPNYTRLTTADPQPKSELERNREFLQAIGIDAPALQPTIWLTKEDELFADDFFRTHKLETDKTIALFAVGQWGQKVYDRYGEALGELCRDSDFTVIAFGASGDKEINDRTLKSLDCRTINLAGQTSLRQTAALIKRCRLGVGADTGTAHLACAVGIPNVVMLGGGHFGRFFPYSPLTSVVCLPLECYHCNWECRYNRVHCIKNIAPEVLRDAVTRTLAGGADKPRIFVAAEEFRQVRPGEPAWSPVTELLDPDSVAIVTVGKQAAAAKVHLEPVATADRQAGRRKVAGKRR